MVVRCYDTESSSCPTASAFKGIAQHHRTDRKIGEKICATNEVCTAFTPMVDAEIDFKEISIGSFTQAFKTLLLQVTISFEVLLAKDLIDATKNLTCFTRYRAVSRMYIWRRTINYLCSAGNRKTCSIYF